MEELRITGQIVKILPAQTGTSARGEWKRQEFVIRTDEQYPKEICIGNFNNRVNLEGLAEGAMVTCSVNIESREYNGKWYTNVTAWKMEAAGAAMSQPVNAPNQPASNAPVFPSNEQPFGASSNASEGAGDLPF